MGDGVLGQKAGPFRRLTTIYALCSLPLHGLRWKQRPFDGQAACCGCWLTPPFPPGQLCTTVPLSPPTPFPLHARLMDVGGMLAALWSGAVHAAAYCLRKHMCVWARADRREKGETIIIINAMTRDRDLQCKPRGVAVLAIRDRV